MQWQLGTACLLKSGSAAVFCNWELHAVNAAALKAASQLRCCICLLSVTLLVCWLLLSCKQGSAPTLLMCSKYGCRCRMNLAQQQAGKQQGRQQQPQQYGRS